MASPGQPFPDQTPPRTRPEAMEDIVMDGEVTPPASPPWEPREGGGLFGGDLGRRCGHTHTLPQPLPPALVMPPPFDHGHYGGGPLYGYSSHNDPNASGLTTPRPRLSHSLELPQGILNMVNSSPKPPLPPRALEDLTIRQPMFSDPGMPCEMDDDDDSTSPLRAGFGSAAAVGGGRRPSGLSERPPLSRGSREGVGLFTAPPARTVFAGGAAAPPPPFAPLHPALDAENIPPPPGAAAMCHNGLVSPTTVPDAPRKKPPTSPPLLGGMATASASKCRERLAAAARDHRWGGWAAAGTGGSSQNGSRGPSPSGAHTAGGMGGGQRLNFTYVGAEALPPQPQPPCKVSHSIERSHTFTGTRKRLDDTLDDVMGFSLVTPKRMRAAEDLFSRMNL